jgi:hypothetical protein
MRINAKLKSQKLNKKIFQDIKKLETKIKAGYPKENPQSSAVDKNGYSATHKAYKINYENKNFVPYLQISYENNKIKYQKRFMTIAKQGNKKLDKKLDKLGSEMVSDIKHTLAGIQHSPTSNSTGCIFGALSFVRIK